MMPSNTKRRPVSLLAILGVVIVWWYNLALFASNRLAENQPLMIRRVELQEPHKTTTSTSTDATTPSLLVQPGDSIYQSKDWDGAPVVLEEQKLLFFTSAKVGCTVWKQLFRRIMGASDWKAEATRDLLPWNPELNGLKYLHDYDAVTASHMMTSDAWTRAIFVRDPKERLLSAYLDKGVTNSKFMQAKCCKKIGNCTEAAKESLESFFGLTQWCNNVHWDPQSRRMPDKYWPFINYVGHMESVGADAERLLRQVGAWEQYGKTGWGEQGNLSIFEAKAGGTGRIHATNARDRLRGHYTPDLERQVEAYYKSDYANPVMNLTKVNIYQ